MDYIANFRAGRTGHIKDKVMSTRIQELAAGKPVAIFGTGVSGVAAKKLLDSLGIESVFYAETGTKKTGEIDGVLLKPFDEENAKRHSLVVYSPAFRPDHKWIKTANASGAKAICEPDLSALAWSGKIFAVTGTNGKTTLTSFITHALVEGGFDAVSAGNIGQSLSSFCPQFGNDKNKIAVCELSSFQTANLSYLRPDALLWTNFAPDHLDWHIDMEEYFVSKFNLVDATIGGQIVVGSSVEDACTQYEKALPKSAIVLDEDNPVDAPSPFDSKIQARNFEMAVEFGKLAGIKRELFENAAKTFSLPAHRFSKPVEINGVKFYNDSKATNAHAAIAAIEELKNENDLIWIGGGKDKYCDLESLVETVSENARCAVLIGQTAQKLKSMLESKSYKGAAFVCNSMSEAVKKAYELSKKNSAVLFSPAFSSFGMFSGYAERGKSFENEVLCLKNLKI